MNNLNAKKLIKIFAFSLAFIVVTGYSLHQSRNLLSGPGLEINEPLNGSTIATSTVLVAGKTENISRISLNGRQIFTDENGNFSMNVMLLKGYNVVTISAEDKFGREVIKTIQLVYKND